MKYLKIETLIHVIMIVFAIASVFNIGFYLSSTHNEITSWAIANSLGFGLVAISLILSKIDYKQNFDLFVKLLVATLAVWLLSGTLQTLAYHSHDLHWFLAALFGYGFPLVAEVILALAISAYDLYNHDEKIKSAKQSLYEKSAIVLSETVANYDTKLIQQHIDTQITNIVKSQVDDVLKEMFFQRQPVIHNFNPQIEVNPTINVITDNPLTKEELFEHLKTNYTGQFVQELPIPKIAKELKQKRSIITQYITELQQQDKLKAFIY